ncbi:hypothetical protein ACVRG4_005066, partial [Escherichia coli]
MSAILQPETVGYYLHVHSSVSAISWHQTIKIISDRYYLRESPATFPVRGVLSFFTGNTCMNPSDAIEAIEKPLSS